MSDETRQSGSRWESVPAEAEGRQPDPGRQETELVAAAGGATRPRSRRRGAVLVAVAALAGLLVGGAGGYAVGHGSATAGPGVHERGAHGPDGGLRGPGAGSGTGPSGATPFTAGSAT